MHFLSLEEQNRYIRAVHHTRANKALIYIESAFGRGRNIWKRHISRDEM